MSKDTFDFAAPVPWDDDEGAPGLAPALSPGEIAAAVEAMRARCEAIALSKRAVLIKDANQSFEAQDQGSAILLRERAIGAGIVADAIAAFENKLQRPSPYRLPGGSCLCGKTEGCVHPDCKDKP
jgi:hypothetical protein